MRSVISLAFAASLVVACYTCKDPACSNLPPAPVGPDGEYPADGIVEVLPDDSPAAASSPCGRAAANWTKLGCPEGQKSATGVTPYRVCVHMASRQKVPAACWANAKDIAALRRCGSIRCNVKIGYRDDGPSDRTGLILGDADVFTIGGTGFVHGGGSNDTQVSPAQQIDLTP